MRTIKTQIFVCFVWLNREQCCACETSPRLLALITIRTENSTGRFLTINHLAAQPRSFSSEIPESSLFHRHRWLHWKLISQRKETHKPVWIVHVRWWNVFHLKSDEAFDCSTFDDGSEQVRVAFVNLIMSSIRIQLELMKALACKIVR